MFSQSVSLFKGLVALSVIKPQKIKKHTHTHKSPPRELLVQSWKITAREVILTALAFSTASNSRQQILTFTTVRAEKCSLVHAHSLSGSGPNGLPLSIRSQLSAARLPSSMITFPSTWRTLKIFAVSVLSWITKWQNLWRVNTMRLLKAQCNFILPTLASAAIFNHWFLSNEHLVAFTLSDLQTVPFPVRPTTVEGFYKILSK